MLTVQIPSEIVDKWFLTANSIAVRRISIARLPSVSNRPFEFHLCQCARHLGGTSSLSKMKLQAEQPLSGSKFSVSWLDHHTGKYRREIGPQKTHADLCQVRT